MATPRHISPAAASAAAFETEDDNSLDELRCQPADVDPELFCSICLNVFTHPVRTQCGHVFCHSCIDTWLLVKGQCPECRAEVESTTPDKLAERLCANTNGPCQLSRDGCGWMGKRGDMPAHLANECPCVTMCCPNEACGAEMLRRDLSTHLQCCPAGGHDECPWGCGESVSFAEMEAHKAACLLEPRKLLAAIRMLQLENERLATENKRLESSELDVPPAPPPPSAASAHLRRKVRARRSGPGVSTD